MDKDKGKEALDIRLPPNSVGLMLTEVNEEGLGISLYNNMPADGDTSLVAVIGGLIYLLYEDVETVNTAAMKCIEEKFLQKLEQQATSVKDAEPDWAKDVQGEG